MQRQEQLLEQQLQESRVGMQAMKEQQRVASERSEKTYADAEARRKESEENLKVKQAKTEYQMQKGISKISDKTRGRAGLKIDKTTETMGVLNPIESLVNLPV